MQQRIITLLTPADIISMINALFGFLALMVLSCSFLDYSLIYRLSFTFIFLGILADGLDGVIARKTTKGLLGPYLESMADFTTTGIATSMFVLHLYRQQIIETSEVLFIFFSGLLLLYLLCNLIRLAAFHPLNTVDHFRGLPAPAASIILILSAYIGLSIMYVFPLLLVISILMVSPFKYMKPTMHMNIAITCLIIVILIVDTLWDAVFHWVLLLWMALYVIISPIHSLRIYK